MKALKGWEEIPAGWGYSDRRVVRMRLMRKNGPRKGFSLLELLVAVTVVTILISISAVVYDGYRDRVAMMVDETNQKVLQAAAKLYAYDNDALPGLLSDLRPEDYQRAYARVVEGKRPYTVLAHLQEIWQEHIGVDTAEAFLPARYFNRDLKLISCPSDATPPTGFDGGGRAIGGISYALRPGVANRPLTWLLDSNNAGLVLIVESDDSSTVVFRHQKGTRTVGITVGGKHRQMDPSDPDLI
jgi:prepilin-type N-terminal cleavage/methylation domain-containing protein